MQTDVFDFPDNNQLHDGLTKREYFAGLAMQGMLAAMNGFDATPSFNKFLAESAVKQADALIKALNLTP